MQINPPKMFDLSFDLYPKGKVYFGRSSFGKGQHVGTAPIVAKFENIDGHPNGLFVIRTCKSMLEISKLMKEAKGFIPDWLRADLYEFLYREGTSIAQPSGPFMEGVPIPQATGTFMDELGDLVSKWNFKAVKIVRLEDKMDLHYVNGDIGVDIRFSCYVEEDGIICYEFLLEDYANGQMIFDPDSKSLQEIDSLIEGWYSDIVI